MKKYRKRNIYFDSNNSDPNDKYNSNIDTFHNKKIKNFDDYEKIEIPKIKEKIKIIEDNLNQETNQILILELNEEIKKLKSKILNFEKRK